MPGCTQCSRLVSSAWARTTSSSCEARSLPSGVANAITRWPVASTAPVSWVWMCPLSAQSTP